jgi:PIN domain nuclease of toxin-antitoxin system
VSDQFFVTDTHALVWYLAKQDAKLPKKVFAAFKSAQESNGTHIWVPAAVAWEISLLMRKTSRISSLGSFEELIFENFYFKSMTITDLQPEDIITAHSLEFNKDPFDSLIVATALRMNLPLITSDSDIIDSNVCKFFWC